MDGKSKKLNMEDMNYDIKKFERYRLVLIRSASLNFHWKTGKY